MIWFVYYVVAVTSFKVGLGDCKQRLLVNQCLLSCCINTNITIDANDQCLVLKLQVVLFLVSKWWRNFGTFGYKIMGTLDFQVKVPYLGGNICQQREIIMICFSFISFLHARHLLTLYKKIGNYLLCGVRLVNSNCYISMVLIMSS